MKKILVLALIAIMVFSLCACGGSQPKEETKAEETTTNETSKAQETAELIQSAYSSCYTGMYYMLKAWNFCIENGNTKEFDGLWDKFLQTMVLNDDAVKDAMKSELGATDEDLANTLLPGINLATNPSYTIPVARYCWIHKNPNPLTGEYDILQTINEKLDNVKTNLQEMESDNESYNLLKEYYLMTSNMKDWINNPSGNFKETSQLLSNNKQHAEEWNKELELIIK